MRRRTPRSPVRGVAQVPTYDPYRGPGGNGETKFWDAFPYPHAAPLFNTRYWRSPDHSPISVEPRGDDSEFIMTELLQFVRQQVAEEQRFLAFGWFHAPHLPVVSAPPWTDGYAPAFFGDGQGTPLATAHGSSFALPAPSVSDMCPAGHGPTSSGGRFAQLRG